MENPPSTSSTEWDPLKLASQQVLHKPSAACLRRLAAELSGFQDDPLPGVTVCPDENIATLIHALIKGPEGTPYEGGRFHFVLYAKANYPHEAPLARLMTTGAGSVRFNPQFYTSGKVCLSILHTWPGPGWNPSFNMRVVILQLQALMNEQPALNEPGVMIMNNPEEYNAYLRHETLRVAVLGILEQCFRRASAAHAVEEAQPEMPRELAEVALYSLMQEASRLEARCRELAASTPDGCMLPGVPRSVRAEYSAMASQLRALRQPKPAAPEPGAEEAVEPEPPVEPSPEAAEAGAVAAEAPAPEEEPECRICGGGTEDPGACKTWLTSCLASASQTQQQDGELLQPCGPGPEI